MGKNHCKMRGVLFAALLVGVASALSCLDEGGNPADWFVAMKRPDGTTYYYTDASSSTGGRLHLSSSDLNSPGAIYYSVGQIYRQNSTQGLLVWNDETPDDHQSSSHAHAKGMLYFDSYGGMYLVHSSPHFPPSSGGYSYPSSSVEFGQSFICVSLGTASVQNVIDSLTVTRPLIYIQSASAALVDQYPLLGGVLNGNYTKTPTGRSYQINTRGGVDFTLFAKNHYWDDYLYENLVAPTLSTDLICETWTNGALSNIVPTYCTSDGYDYNVYNAEHVMFGAGDEWARTQDHSKWCVGVSSDWMCIGGINRQVSQNGRGGGTLCTRQVSLQPTFHTAVVDVNPCGTGKVTDNGSQPPTPMRKKIPVV